MTSLRATAPIARAATRLSTCFTDTRAPTLDTSGPPAGQLHLIAERVFASGAAREMIPVMPNGMNAFGGSMYSNSVTAGNWERYVAAHPVVYMDNNYRTIASRDGRGLAGHSMGGDGTICIGMKRPNVFSAIQPRSQFLLPERRDGPGTWNGPLGGGAGEDDRRGARGNRGAQGTLARAAAWAPNPNNPPFYVDLPTKNGEVVPEVAVKWAANSPVAMLDQYVPNLKKMKAIALDIGLQDNLITGNRLLVERMTAFGITHTFETYEGDHGNRIPERLEQKVLPFFLKHLSTH